MITIHVALLTTVESVARHFMHGLFNLEVDGRGWHVVVVVTACILLMNMIRRSMFSSLKLVINIDLVMLVITIKVRMFSVMELITT